MEQYLGVLKHVLENGSKIEDRTGTGTLKTFGYQSRYNLEKGFPLLTTKKLHVESIIHELLWFLRGETNINYLKWNGIKIWDEWADENNEVGKLYGHQWRSWEAIKSSSDGLKLIRIDQIKETIKNLINNPYSRRHVISAWNVGQLDEMNLPPCHIIMQFDVDDQKRLSLQVYQRSCDVFLGLPFNIASYSLLLMMVAQVCGYKPYEFIHTLGDTHLYLNHLSQAKLQLKRNPRKLPTITLNPKVTNIDDFKFNDFLLQNYYPHPHIKGIVSV